MVFEKKERKASGFAISIDALLATILTLSVLAFVGLGIQADETTIAQSAINIKQAADDAFTALDNSGALAKYLADLELTETTLSNPGDPDSPGIYNEVKDMLPENAGLKIVITEYLPVEDADLEACRASRTFDDCFGSAYYARQEFPSTGLPGKEIMHGRKIVVMRETAAGKETPEGRECIPEHLVFELKEAGEESLAIKALFQGEPEADVETLIEVTDSAGNDFNADNSLVCYDQGTEANETAEVTLKTRNRTRDPIAIMLAMDKSGSMGEYDMLEQQSTGTLDEGTCNESACVGGKGKKIICEGLTNWQEIGSITVDSGFFPDGDELGYVKIYMDWSGYSGNCSSPRLRASYSNGEETRYKQDDSGVPLVVTIGKNDVATGETIHIYGWSDETISYSLYYLRYEAMGWEPIDSATFNDGTFDTPSTTTCSNYSDWHQIGTIAINEPVFRLEARMNYSDYTGPCSVRFMLKDPNGNPYSTDCGSSASGSCTIARTSVPTGTWTVWGWADEQITVDVNYYYHYYNETEWQQIANTAFDAGTVQEKTVISEECSTSENWQDIGSFEVDSSVQTVKVKMDFSGYTGICSARLKMIDPSSTEFETECSGITGSCELLASASAGTWAIKGWSDSLIDASTYHKLIYPMEETGWQNDYEGQFNDGPISQDSQTVVLSYDNWQQLGTLEESSGTLAWMEVRLDYSGYVGQKGVRVRLAEPSPMNPEDYLVGYWKFDEGTGITAGDSTGTNNGTLYNMGESDWVDGPSGTALNFDGINDYIGIPHRSSLNPDYLTMQAWVRPEGGGNIIMSKESNYLWGRIGGNVRWALNTTGKSWYWVDTGISLPSNEWKKVELSYDGYYVESYVDGSLEHTYQYKYDALRKYTRGLGIAARGMFSSISGYFDARIDEVKFYSADVKFESERYCGTGFAGTCYLKKYYQPNTSYYTNRSPQGTWTVSGWSDGIIAATAYYRYRKHFSTGWQNIASGYQFNDGTADMDVQTSCTNYGNFVKLTEFNLSDPKIRRVQVKLDYDGYGGQCMVQARLIDPNSTTYSANCGETASNGCMLFSGTYTGNIPTGMWEVWGWSEDEIDVNVYYRHEWEYSSIGGGSVDSGNCLGQSCAYSNCFSKENFVPLKQITLPAYSKGEVKITFSGYSGICQPAFQAVYSTTEAGKCYMQDSSSGECFIDIGNNGSSSQKVSIKGWSDEDITYSIETRIYENGSRGSASIDLTAYLQTSGFHPTNWAQFYNSDTEYGTMLESVSGSGIVSEIYDSAWSGNNPFGRDDYYSKHYDGYIYAETPGYYTIAIDCDDGCTVFVDGGEIRNWYSGGGRCNCWDYSREIWLPQGYHNVDVWMEEDTSGDNVRLGWREPFQASTGKVPSRAFEINPQSVSGGTATGQGSTCAGFSNWVLLNSFTAPSNAKKVFGQVVFPAYDGKCDTPAMKLVAPDALEYVQANNCIQRGSEFYCTVEQDFSPGYAPTGIWQLYGWSDTPQTAYPAYSYLTIEADSGNFDNGLCYNGQNCSEQISTCQNLTDWKQLGTFDVDKHSIAMKIDFETKGYAGECGSAMVRLKDTAGNIAVEKACRASCSIEYTGTGVMYLPMDSVSDGRVLDHSPHTNDGTLQGGLSQSDLVRGYFGSALGFDGSNDYVEVSIDVSETSYTASLWFKTTCSNCGIFSVVDSSLGVGGHDRHIYLSGGKLCTSVYSSETICTSGVNYADGGWHHVTHVFGGSVGGQKIFVDGVQRASGSKSSSDFGWQKGIHVGFSNDAANDYFNGLIDEVRVYNRALTTAEISELYNALGPPFSIAMGSYSVEVWADEVTDFWANFYVTRIDSAKNASKKFIDNASWKDDDEIGLLSFSTTATPEQWLTSNKELTKGSLDELLPNGLTAIADAIDTSLDEFAIARPDAGKFIVLLTDGKANICRGGNSCSESQAAAQAIEAADEARLEGVRIYVIGFADESIIGTYEADLNAIALDKDDERFKADCESGALQNCGKYYYAADERALQEMYNIIAFEIARIMENVKIKIPVPDGMEFSNYGNESNKKCGIWDDKLDGFTFPGVNCFGQCSSGNETCVGGETLTYPNLAIAGELWWVAKFDVKLPCGAANCYQEYVLFPPLDLEIIENENAVSWDGKKGETRECGPNENTKCHKKIPFKYADLNVVFTYGIMSLPLMDNVKIDLEISNDSNRNIGIASSPLPSGLEIAFYKKDHSNKLGIAWAGSGVFMGDEGDNPVTLDTISADGNLYLAMSASAPNNICSWKEGNCQPPPTYYPSYWKVRLEGLELSGCNPDCEGTIIVEINQNKQVGECPLYNTAKLICSGERLRFFTIDYYAWVK